MAKIKAFNPDQRRRALRQFMNDHELKVFPWATAAGISEGTVRNFLSGDSDSLSERTYELLARAAEVPVSELRGEGTPVARQVEIGVRHIIGAGDVIHIIEDSDPFDYTDAPPGFEKASAGIVRGDSMLPRFDEGDVLFWRRLEQPPKTLPVRAVIVKVKDGALYLKKLLPGTRRGRYHLVSINPVTKTLIDQPVEAIARIGWVKPVE